MELDNVDDVYPLSPTQAGMLFHTLSAPHSGVYVGQLSCTLLGRLDPSAFKAAWEDALVRHPALRTAFFWDGLDDPLQVVRQRVDLCWEVSDWRQKTAAGAQGALAERMHKERREGFDLSQAPLMRMLLLRFEDSAYRFVWTCHHLLVDGWSTAVVMREVLQLYQARLGQSLPGLAPTMPFRNYLGWLKQRDEEPSRSFWQAYLSGVRTPTRLSASPAFDNQDGLYITQRKTLSSAITASLVRCAKAQRVTLSTLVHGAWALLLQRYSSVEDIVFGTTVSGRPAELPGIEDAVGLFINTLPVRVGIPVGLELGQWLTSLQQNLLQLRAHEHTSLVRIKEWSEVPAREPLFDTLVVFESFPALSEEPGERDELRLTDLETLDQSNYPMVLLVAPGEALQLSAVYDPSQYDSDAVTRILAHLENLLAGFPSHVKAAVDRIPMLSGAEHELLCGEWNRTETPLPTNTTVLDLIAKRARTTPQAAALVDDTRRLTYAELDAAADSSARYLIHRGVNTGEPVGLLMHRGVDLIVAMLAILRAGGAYLPLDPKYPEQRVMAMLRASGATMVLTSNDVVPRLPATGIRCATLQDRPPAGSRNQMPRVRDDGLAYLIYTSGSTGTPKGVPVSHRNLLSSTLARHHYYDHQPGIFLLLSSVAFDSSVAGIFWTLSSGGCLVIAAHRLEQDMARLSQCVAANGVTHTLCLPSVHRLLLEYGDHGALGSLRTVIVAGEPFPAGLLARHRQDLPWATLFNEYGPTEATVWCTVLNTRNHPSEAPVSIGRPIANTRIYILDDIGRQVPVGLAGEICVAGEGVVSGYLGDAEATAENFITRSIGDREERLYRTGDRGRFLPNGAIEFLGRMDRQLKVRGYRVDPVEIEAALCRYPGIGEAVVMPIRRSPGEGMDRADENVPDISWTGLFAFVARTPGTAEDQSVTDLRRHLVAELPEYMVPTDFLLLDALPRLPNGKADADALQRLAGQAGPKMVPHTKPRTSAETTLARIWQQVLHVDTVGIHDNFFDLGGDSILSISVVSRAGQENLSLSLNDLFNFPTVAQLAARSEARSEASVVGGLETRVAARGRSASQPTGPATDTDMPIPLFLVHAGSRAAARLREILGPEWPVYVFSGHWDHGNLEPDATVERLADETLHELRSLQPDGPYLIGGFSMGAPIALEMAQRLRQRGECVELLFLLDPPPPDDRPASPSVSAADAEDPNAADSEQGRVAVTHDNPLARHWRTIAGLPSRDKLHYVVKEVGAQLRFRVKAPLARLCRKRVVEPVQLKLAGLCRRLHVRAPLAARYLYVRTVYHRAWLRYRHKPYAGDLVIFRKRHGLNVGYDAQWEALTQGSLQIETFEGGHLDFQQNPDLIGEWAPRLATILNAPKPSVTTTDGVSTVKQSTGHA